jgi:hypothetical protein
VVAVGNETIKKQLQVNSLVQHRRHLGGRAVYPRFDRRRHHGSHGYNKHNASNTGDWSGIYPYE